MTHVKNAEAFARLVDFCTGYGGNYNPGQSTLRIEALNTQKQEVASALARVISAKTAYDDKVNERKQLFDQLPRLVSSTLRLLESANVSKEKLEDARAFAQKVVGKSPKGKVAAPAEGVADNSSRSLLQMSYASRVDSFAALIDTVSTEPRYQPNEPDLTVAGLQGKLNQLRTLNQEVSAARVIWSNSIIERNKSLYGPAGSLVKTARAVKRYVRAIFGHDSDQYAQLKNIDFVKIT